MNMRKDYFKNMSHLVAFGLIVVMSVFATAWMANGAEVIDRIVAVVNNDIIALTDLNRESKQGVAQIKAQDLPEEQKKEELSKYRLYMINQLINQALIDQEIKRYGISVAEEEIDQSITQLREEKGLSEKQFEEEVKKHLGLSVSEYREKVKEQLLRMKLINSEVQSKVVITEEDKKLFYKRYEEEHPGGKRYHLRNIIMKISSDTSEDEKQKILKKMQEVSEELEEGASFTAMADKYSDSSKNGEGGDLGFLRFTDLSSKMQKALTNIDEGQFTSIIDTEMGYQILYVEKIEEDTGKSLEEAAPDIDKQIYNASVSMKFQNWLMELRKRSYIEIIE